jgi:hypothetical protein
MWVYVGLGWEQKEVDGNLWEQKEFDENLIGTKGF